MGKSTWGNKAKHHWVMSKNFLLSKVCWQCPAMFCLYRIRRFRFVKTCDERFPGVYLVTRFLEYTSDLLELSNVTWFFPVLDDVDTWSLEMLDSRLRFIGVFRELRKSVFSWIEFLIFISKSAHQFMYSSDWYT